MDALLSAALLLALAAPVGLAAAWLVVKGPSGLAGFLGPQPGLGWPHGVQEEDPASWNLNALGRTEAGWARPGDGGSRGMGAVGGTDGGPLSGIFPGDQSLGWPPGVQEEEPVAWQWDEPAPSPSPPSSERAASPLIEPVVFRMRRPARDGVAGRRGLPR